MWTDIKSPAEFLYRVYINRTFRKLVPGLIIFTVIMLLPMPEDLGYRGHRAIALFVLIVYLWVTESCP